MIQSDKFDSSNMDIKKLSNTALTFIIKRLIEIFGICVSLLGICILIALISYSPEDPNFIFPENTEIKNILGFQGSRVSDLIFQSIGLVAYLLPITLMFTGFNILKRKKILLIIENTFLIVVYSIFGSLFFSLFFNQDFELYINGSGGFVGDYLSQTFIKDFVNSYENFFYYFLILLVITFFLLSINFSLKSFIDGIKKLINISFRRDSKNYTNKNELIDEFIPQDEIKDLIQEDLPFIKTENNKIIFTAKSNTAKIHQDKIIFNKETSFKNFINESLQTQSVVFNVPIESRIPFKKVNNLGMRDIISYRKIFSQSNLDKDILFNSHLDKVFYKTILKPISIIALIIYFGSLIFSSLRDSTIGGRIIVAVTGAFVFRLLQDLSVGIFISYSLPVLIGVIIPIAVLILLSIFSYKKI